MTPDSASPDTSGGPSRPQDPLYYERRFWGRGALVVGVDEAGRGPLAGPVVAAAVVLPPGIEVEGADDSKKLAAPVREELHRAILASARAVGVGAASVREIDRLDILRATTRAMQRALASLDAALEASRDLQDISESPRIVIDGMPVRGLGREHEAVVDGDALIHSVGCASIVAKVVRDRLMRRLAARYPGYGWETNVGYGTAQHRQAIRDLGHTPHHRLSFGAQMELEL